jgi:adenosine deaminase
MLFESVKNYYDCMPKVELHLHLEGAIPCDAMWQLVQKYGGDPAIPDPEALKHRFEYKDFPHFIETWGWKNQFLREYEDFNFIAEQVARDLVYQHIYYAEIFYSPPDFARHGLKTQEITEAIRKGFSRVPEIEIGLIVDLVRDFGPERAAVTLQEVNEVKNLGVIGIGMGGSEHAFPPKLFADVYEEARRLGFHTTAHAGEAAGAKSIWGAVRSLKVERIGHGTRAYEDEGLLDFLADRQIPLEMCPLSNLCTGVVSRIEEHPVRRYFEKGIIVTINTDDPKMFGNSLAQEYEVLEKTLGFSPREIRSLMVNAVKASWLPEQKKQQMVEEIMTNHYEIGED